MATCRRRPLRGTSASQPSGSLRAEHALELGGLGGEVAAVGLEALAPRGLQRLAARHALAEVRERLVGDEERLEAREAVDLLGEPDLLLAQRRAVGAVGVLLVRGSRARCGCARRSATGARPPAPRARPPRCGRGRGPRRGSARASRRPRSAWHVLGERQRGVALDRDVVVVVEADQAAEPRWPASEQASDATPSWRSPSEAIT